MTNRKGRSKAQKSQTSKIPSLAVQKKAGQSESLEQDHSRSGSDVEMSASAVSSAHLISQLTETVEMQEAELEMVKLELNFKHLALESLEAKLDSSQEQVEKLKKTLRVERRKFQRTHALKLTLQQKVRLLSTVILPDTQKKVKMVTKLLDKSQSENEELQQQIIFDAEQVQPKHDRLKKKLADVLTEAAEEAEELGEVLLSAKKELEQSRKDIRKLKSQKAEIQQLTKAYIKKAKDTKTYKATCKGIYTPEMRSLALFLVEAGCSRDHVGEVIERVFNIAGVSVKGKMSGRTVTRCIIEGGIAAQIQLGFEMAVAPSLAIAGDGTTHENVNFDAKLVHLPVENYTDDKSAKSKHATRTLGVHSALNHTSETQVNGWKEVLLEIVEIFMNSPLAKSAHMQLSLKQFFEKLKGMNSDHAEDQKKAFRLFEKLKRDFAMEALGSKKISEMHTHDFNKILGKRHADLINECEGEEVWDELAEDEQTKKLAELLQDVSIEMGENEWETLSSDQQEEMLEFFWVGCGMHKDLNGVKGGNVAMRKWWIETGTPGPVLLANKDNAAIIDAIPDDDDVEELTPAELRAIEVSACGGVKTTTLAGFLFNHPNDKKGQQKMHQHWFEKKTGKRGVFPDTGNTRYGSHCLAACELIVNLELYNEFMEVIRIQKEKQKLNHLEGNLARALKDIPTITELAVLAMYHLAVTCPYLAEIRRPEDEELNMLELGPLHQELKLHCQKIIDNPDDLIGDSATHKTGVFHGQEWNDAKVVEAVTKLKPNLPHLKPLLVAFFTKALETWERFTSEFAEGGLIDKATSEQKMRAWMPTTNDRSEGSLGDLRLYARKKSNWALHIYNALKMFQKNDTRAFLARHATPDLMQYIRTLARQRDGSKLEEHRRNQLAAHADEVVEAKRKKQRKRENQALEKAQEIEKSPWVESESEVNEMTVAAIKMQLEKYRSRIEDIPKKSEINKMKKAALVLFLKAIVTQHKAAVSASLLADTSSMAPSLQSTIPGALQQTIAVDQSLYIGDLTGLLVSQLKAHLELYRTSTDLNIPKKSEINQMKKASLVDLLNSIIAQHTSIQAVALDRNVNVNAQAGGSIMAEEAPARMEDLTKIKSSKTTKTMLKVQLELYRNLVPGIPASDQLEGKKKNELVDLLVNAVNQCKSS